MLNSTLAGGVAVGTSADLVTNAAIAMAIGAVAGLISTLGYMRMNAVLQSKLKIHDTCGVLFLHGLPGVLGGLCGAIAAGTADASLSESVEVLAVTFPMLAEGRTVQEQGWV